MSETRDLSTNNLEMMQVLARNDQDLADIKNLTSSKVTDQLKVFLIAQARNELQRVVKLTRFLDLLEDRFMNKVTSEIDDLSLRQYSDIISTITDLLGRSNSIISQVLKDDSLMTILNTTIYNTVDQTMSSTVVALKDSQSRERVRVAINSLLYSLDNYGERKQVIGEENH